jgi:hypothetical protein
MARKVAIGIWAVLAFILVAVVLDELLGEADVSDLVLGASLATICAWLALRLWRRPSRTVAIIAACTGVAVAILVLAVILEGKLGLFPGGLTVLSVLLAGSFLPLRSPEVTARRAPSHDEP